MTALIVLGILLVAIVLAMLARLIYRKSVEQYRVNLFCVGKFAFMAAAVAMAGIGAGLDWWVYESGGNFVLAGGLNAIVLYVARGLMYLGQTIWMTRKTNFAIGIAAPVLLFFLAATFLAVVAFILYRALDTKKSRGNENQ